MADFSTAVLITPGKSELHALAETLPVGKLFARGRAFAPYVARTTFEKLAVLVQGGVTIEQRYAAGVHSVFPLAEMFTTKAINIADALWAKIVLGTVVLASQGGKPGWWPGLVVAIDGHDLTLCWMEDPATKFRVRRRDVALCHPAMGD